MRIPKARQNRQLELAPRKPNKDHPGWGGVRMGAGRPRSAKGVRHEVRPRLASRHPVHVTLRVDAALGQLRTKLKLGAIRQAMREAHAKGVEAFRVLHFSVQSTHVHLIVEAKGKDELSHGMKGFEVRMARKLNRIVRRKGRVFSDRYHAHVLKTPAEVRHAYAYVLLNRRHHAASFAARSHVDPFSSGMRFEGWDRRVSLPPGYEDEDVPIETPKTWLARTGWWLNTRLISPHEIPGKPH